MRELLVNLKCKFAGGDRMGDEFKYIEKWIKGEHGNMKKGVDIGCGTNRLSMEVLAIDANPMRKFAHADVVHNCHNLEVGKEIIFNEQVYKFEDNELDFIFSSHCLEDFGDIPVVFENWWKKLKVNGLMILLLPDMEICDCEICKSGQQKEYREKQKMSARYWTLEDYKKTNKGNPTHRTNVGKKFMTDLLQNFREKDKIDYEILQEDTVPHDKGCSIDFVIKKIK